jgi:hypothetical protein
MTADFMYHTTSYKSLDILIKKMYTPTKVSEGSLTFLFTCKKFKVEEQCTHCLWPDLVL